MQFIDLFACNYEFHYSQVMRPTHVMERFVIEAFSSYS